MCHYNCCTIVQNQLICVWFPGGVYCVLLVCVVVGGIAFLLGLYIYTCIYMFIYLYIHTYNFIHICIIYSYIYTHLCALTRLCLCSHAFMHSFTPPFIDDVGFVSLKAFDYVGIRVCSSVLPLVELFVACVCVCVCVCVCLCVRCSSFAFFIRAHVSFVIVFLFGCVSPKKAPNPAGHKLWVAGSQ